MTSLKNNDCSLVSSAIHGITERKKAKLAIHLANQREAELHARH
jgi:hypothetical protein